MLRFLRRKLPRRRQIVQHWSIRPFAHHLNHPRHWRLHRNSVSQAVFIGLISAWNPIPFTQMVMAAAWAAGTHANIPTAVALSWLSNPFTVFPMLYGAYWVGSRVLSLVLPQWEQVPYSLNDLWSQDSALIPLAVGCLLIALTTAFLGRFITQYLWRRHILKKREKHKQRRVETLLASG